MASDAASSGVNAVSSVGSGENFVSFLLLPHDHKYAHMFISTKTVLGL
jgi:hypothetical protein